MSNTYYSSEQAFRIYEPIILQAVTALPNPISFVTKDEARRATTDAARCRDAISSWRIHRWDSQLNQVASHVATLRTWVWNNRAFIGTKIAFVEFDSIRAHAEAYNKPFDISHINHYVLTEAVTNPDPPPILPGHPAHSPRLRFDQRLAPRPLLFPKPFRTDDIPIIPSTHPAVQNVTEAILSPQQPLPPDAKTMSLPELIDEIDSGRIVGQHHVDLSLLDEVKSLVAGRLNVAFAVKDDQIVIF